MNNRRELIRVCECGTMRHARLTARLSRCSTQDFSDQAGAVDVDNRTGKVFRVDEECAVVDFALDRDSRFLDSV